MGSYPALSGFRDETWTSRRVDFDVFRYWLTTGHDWIARFYRFVKIRIDLCITEKRTTADSSVSSDNTREDFKTRERL